MKNNFKKEFVRIEPEDVTKELENSPIETLNIEPIAIPDELKIINFAEYKYIAVPSILFVIGAAIAKGALSWVGGKIMNSIFGSSSTDLSDAINQIVTKVAITIRQTIQESILQQTVTLAHNAQTALSFYLNAPTNDRLEHITNNIHNAVGQLRTMGLAAHPSYIDALCFYLVVMQERGFRFTSNQRGEYYNMLVLIMQAREYQAYEVPKLWKEWNLQNYKVTRVSRTHYGLFWNGKRVLTSSSETECHQYIPTHNENVYRSEIYPHYVKGGDIIINQLVYMFYAIRHSMQKNDYRPEYLAENTQRFIAGLQPI